MTNHFKQTLSRLVTSIPKKRYIEVAIAAASLLIIGLLVTFITPYSPPAQISAFYTNSSTYEGATYRATVEAIKDDTLSVTLNDGPSKGQSAAVSYTQVASDTFRVGETILVSGVGDTSSYSFFDHFRIPVLVLLCAVFAIVVLLVGRRKGLRSLVGLFASMLVILYVLIPLVLSGFDTFLACILSAVIIAVFTTLASQGFTRRAAIILLCMMFILLLVSIASAIVVAYAALTGRNEETAYFISLVNTNISLSGLISGGIVIATLGALDDIVTTQVAVVDELLKTDTTLSKNELFKRGSRVGAEHIASLVNTLALVYVGAALPVIVNNAIGSGGNMLLLLNSEFAAIEIVRTLIISIGLVLAVPISTFIAAVAFRKQRVLTT